MEANTDVRDIMGVLEEHLRDVDYQMDLILSYYFEAYEGKNTTEAALSLTYECGRFAAYMRVMHRAFTECREMLHKAIEISD